MTSANAELILKRARVGMLIQEPFFGSIALHMELKPDNEIEHCVTDGHTIKYNEAFIESLTHDQATGLVAAQVMHAAMLHPLRRNNREIKKWNKACDFATHSVLKNAGFVLPDKLQIDPKFDGMPAEHIYTLIPDEPSDGKDNSDKNGGVEDSKDSEGNGGSAASQKAAEADMKQRVAQAAHVAKQAGKLPGEIERMLGELMEPVINWAEILRRFMTEKAQDDFSWARGNRRFIAQGLYLPSRTSEGAGEIAVAIDTSGSIGQKELDEFASEVQGIIKDVRPSKLYVIYCDAQINHVDTFAPEDDVFFELHGGGGTDFRPPFQWLEDNQIVPKCFVYLTDGYGPFPDEPEYPAMWAINNRNVTPPWGEHFVMEVQKS